MKQPNQRLPSFISFQHFTPKEKFRRERQGKKRAQLHEIILSGEFYGFVDSWTEYLCLERNPDGSITLTSRSREILAQSGRYKERGWLPATIRRKEVWGYDGD